MIRLLLLVSLPLLILGVLYNPAVPGLYAAAVRIVGAPGNILALAVQRVFLQRAAAMRNAGKQPTRLWTLSTAAMGALGLAPVVILFVWGETLLGILLGDAWREAGAYAALLSLLLFTQWLAAPSVAMLTAARRQRPLLWTSVLALIGQLCVLAWAAATNPEPAHTVTWLVLASASADLLPLPAAFSASRRTAPAEAR